MKKFFRIVLGVFIGLILVIVAVPLILVGIERVTLGSPVDVEDYAGSYQGVSVFYTTLELHDNETYDLYDNGEVIESGTVSSSGRDSITLENHVDQGRIITTELKYNDSKQYLYREHINRSLTGDVIPYFSEDADYGAEVSFDENGRSDQRFFVEYTENDIIELYMNSDGTYTINHNGELSYQGQYSLDGDVLTLQYDDGALKFIFESGNLYFDVYEKQE